MALELERNLDFLPRRLFFCDRVTQIAPQPGYQLNWKPLKESEIFTLTPDIADRFPYEMERIDKTLSFFARTHPPEKHLSERNRRKATRELIGKLFPAIRAVMLNPDHERELFHGLTAEKYINTVALPKAKEFREWVIQENILDEAIKFNLPLMDDISITGNLFDLARRYKHKTIGIEDQTQGVLYSPVEQQQIQSLLGLAYLYTLVDLSRNPDEERLLTDFIQEAGQAYGTGTEDYIDIFLKHDPSGKCVQYTILKPTDNPRHRADTFRRFDRGEFDFYIQQPVRRIERYDEKLTKGFVFFDSREKSHFAEMFKILRGRSIPVEDRHGARFIIEDSDKLDEFINSLKQNMKGWEVVKETVKTTTSSSTKPEGAKFFAYRKGHPDVRIEIQVEWYTKKRYLQGGWLAMRYNKDDNEFAFRVRQLFEGTLQKLLPEEIYKVKWRSLREHLIDLANSKALASLPRKHQY